MSVRESAIPTAGRAGWLLLLTVQVGLVRSHCLALHRRLGRLGVAWLECLALCLYFDPAWMVVARRFRSPRGGELECPE
jgi:hypothetical protein